MREIKFRYIFEDIKEDGRTLVTQLWNLNDIEINDIVYDTEVLIARNQYTGLKDKNGVEIYENDIVSFDNNGFNDRGVVIYDAPCFVVEGFFLIDNSLEVIGNIYKNPDLLKG